jgi:PleD family two-component response regulator
MRAAIAGAPVVSGARTVEVTASFGVAVAEAPTGIDGLVDAADEALYRAKAAGRNQVMRASNGAAPDDPPVSALSGR